jgi:hypothetical protein
VRDTYNACACDSIAAYELYAPVPIVTSVEAGINGDGKGGAYCDSDGVTGFDTESPASVLYYCKEDLEVETAPEKSTDLVPIIGGAVGGLFALGALVMLNKRQQGNKRHAVGNLPGMHKSGWHANPTLLSAPTDQVSQSYGIMPPPSGAPPPVQASGKNPIVGENLERSDSF